MPTSDPDNVNAGLETGVETAESGGVSHLTSVALRTYSQQKPRAISDDEVTEYLPMVHGIARKVSGYLRPPLSFEDLVSAGTIGLLKAARDFDVSHGASFKTYAYIRIKGAILDELRSTSMLPSGTNRQVKEALTLSRQITEETGTAPSDPELAERLGISLDELQGLFDNARTQRFLSLSTAPEDGSALEDSIADDHASPPDEQLSRAELIEQMTAAIAELDSKRRQIVVLYYQQHLTMKQIADVLKITESRVSQLHASAIFNLSARLRDWKDG